MLSYKSLIDIWRKYCEPASSACKIWNYDENDKIRNKIFYKISKQIIVKEIIFPNLLVFILDLSKENEKDDFHYPN